MKRAALYMTVILALALCPILAQAQTLLRADIPFDFTAGNRTMPSGTYVIEDAANHTQLLRCLDSKAAAFVMSNSVTKARPDLSKNVLIFKVYGSNYVLDEIWAGGAGHQVRGSKRPAELAKSERPKEAIVAMQVGN